MSAEATRKRILDATAPIFAERGFAGSTTRVLAEAAGVNVATIAWHFGDKQGLYDAVVDTMQAELLKLALPQDLPDDAEGRVRLLVRTLWEFGASRTVHFRLMLRSVVDAGGPNPRSRWSGEFLVRAQELIVALDLPQDRDVRMPLLSLNHLFVRYVISAPEDVQVFIGPGEDAHAAIGRHLEDTAVQLLLR